MVKPTEMIDLIQQALSAGDWKSVRDSIEELHLNPGRQHIRKTFVSDLNHLLVDKAIKTDNPAFLYAITTFQSNEIEALFSGILCQYIKTKNEVWLKSLLFLSDILGKKSYQSRVFALMARDLIEAGVSHSDPSFLSILFQQEGNGKLSKHMLQSAMKDARIIRPLSRRVFVLCDIAMKCHATGCESGSQEVLDSAIDAATNIRQSALRDEVFDELGLAIKIMQEI